MIVRTDHSLPRSLVVFQKFPYLNGNNVEIHDHIRPTGFSSVGQSDVNLPHPIMTLFILNDPLGQHDDTERSVSVIRNNPGMSSSSSSPSPAYSFHKPRHPRAMWCCWNLEQRPSVFGLLPGQIYLPRPSSDQPRQPHPNSIDRLILKQHTLRAVAKSPESLDPLFA